MGDYLLYQLPPVHPHDLKVDGLPSQSLGSGKAHISCNQYIRALGFFKAGVYTGIDHSFADDL